MSQAETEADVPAVPEDATDAPPAEPSSREAEPVDGAGRADGSARDEPDTDEPDRGGSDAGTAATKPRPKAKPKPFPPVPPAQLEGAVEAILLASGDVLTVERLRDLLGLQSVVHVREALEGISKRWRETAMSVEIQSVAGGVRVTTRPDFAEYVTRLSRRPAADRLSPSLMETLSIVAYRQPVPRVEVERIRGVQAGEALRNLLDRRLLKVVGRSDQPGRPLLYGTTRRFLEVFGLASLKDLPKQGDLQKM